MYKGGSSKSGSAAWHDSVLHTGGRVKVKDLLHLANKRHEQGRCVVRSPVTVSSLSKTDCFVQKSLTKVKTPVMKIDTFKGRMLQMPRSF